MADITTFKQALKRTVIENLGQCLKQLEASLNPNGEAFNNFIALFREFRQLEEEEIAGVLSREARNVEFAQLTRRVLNLIDSLQDGDLAAARHLREETHERLLVVVRAERQAYMERFFSKNYFKNVRYICYGDAVPEEPFDLAILEDMEPEPFSSMTMEQYLDLLACPVLYFGEKFHYNRAKYAEKVYFANSIFALYARIKEMLDFIKYYGQQAQV